MRHTGYATLSTCDFRPNSQIHNEIELAIAHASESPSSTKIHMLKSIHLLKPTKVQNSVAAMLPTPEFKTNSKIRCEIQLANVHGYDSPISAKI